MNLSRPGPWYRKGGIDTTTYMYFTKDIYLDAVSEGGAKELYKLYNDYDLQKGIESNFEFVVPRTYDYLYKQINDGGLCFMVRKRENQEVIGYASLSVNWITHVAKPLLFIVKPHRGKGYGKQLMALLMHIAFQEVNVRKISIVVYSFNEQAIRLYKAVDFKEEGRVMGECYREGTYWDILYLGLFKDEVSPYAMATVTTTVDDPHNSHNPQTNKDND